MATKDLTDELAKDFLEIIPRVMKSIRTEMRASAKKDLTVPQFRVLVQLAGENMGVTSLAEIIGTSTPAMSRMVDCLVKKGLVERAQIESDRRAHRLRLSQHGKTTLNTYKKKVSSKFSQEFEKLQESDRKHLELGLLALKKVSLNAHSAGVKK